MLWGIKNQLWFFCARTFGMMAQFWILKSFALSMFEFCRHFLLFRSKGTKVNKCGKTREKNAKTIR
jgi:hypothetical protein